MSKEQACDYIYASTKTKVKPTEHWVTSFFAEYDSNQDSFLTLSDFKRFYLTKSISNIDVVKQNVFSWGFNNEFEKETIHISWDPTTLLRATLP